MSAARIMRAAERALRRPFVVRTLIVIIALLLFASTAVVSLSYYAARLADNFEWGSKVEVERESRLTEKVFAAAKENHLIAASRDSGGRLLISSPPCEELVLKRTADQDEKRRLLDLFCNSPQGQEIRAEIEAWNTSFDFLAVRDNRSQDATCERQGLVANIFIPAGCKPNKWNFARVIGTGAVSAASGAEPPSEQFGEVVTDPDDLTFYAGDWARVAGDANRDPASPFRYKLTTSVTLPARGEVVIDLVGRLRELRINEQHTKPIDANRPNIEDQILGPVRVSLTLSCEEEDDEEDESAQAAADVEGDEDEEGTETPEMSECTAEPAATARRAIAYRIALSQVGPTSGRVRSRAPLTAEIELVAETLENLPLRMRPGKDSKDRNFRRTRHLVAKCKAGWIRDPRKCNVAWTRLEGSEYRVTTNYRVLVDDGSGSDRDVFDRKTGLIEQDAFDLGLGPLVGVGQQQYGSLAATLAARSRQQVGRRRRSPVASAPPPLTLPLTIDRRVQQAALDVLRDTSWCSSRRAKKKKPIASCAARRKNQTVTLVAIDAGERAGDVLAMASWPPEKTHLHLWDIAALEQGGSSQSGLGWRRVSGNEVPGSTFKAVTALTATEAATRPMVLSPDASKKLSDLLAGRLGADKHADLLRIRYAVAQDKKNSRKCVIVPNKPELGNRIPVPNDGHPRWCARNYKGGNYWAARAAADTGCPKAREGSQFGMCEALMVSSNLFFGGLAEWLWKSAGTAGGEDLLVAQIARRLTFGSHVGLESEGPPSFDLTRGLAPTAKLSADPIHLDIADPSVARANPENVIRAGYGDRVEATPLAIATVYASIGSGQIVRPTVVKVARTGSCPTVKADDDECTPLVHGEEGKAMLARIRAGFHAVAAVRGGTAAHALNTPQRSRLLTLNGAPRLFLKTGTATVIANKRFSLWTAGWIEGAGAGSGIPNRMAFACMITHGGTADTGGGTCAHLVAEFLVRLNEGKLRP
jgi:cell division protein FtsI/penicillin-binding protein 2